MIISRKEFHQRLNVFSPMRIEKRQRGLMKVKDLYKEIQADAPFRNHNYIFEKDVDFRKLPLQEETVGIKKKFPKIGTEHKRCEKVEEELNNNTYEIIPILRDIDYPNVIYVEDGFHRILGHINWELKI